jgi:hypothetical protein
VPEVLAVELNDFFVSHVEAGYGGRL